jgi:hypothetical protein
VLPESADQAVEGHRRDIADGRTPLQAESSVGGEQGLPRYIGTHTAIAQDEVGQHRKDSLARGTLHAPEGETAEANPSIMGVAGKTAAAATRAFVTELEAKSKEKGQDELNERGTHLRRDTVIPQWFQASKAAAASDGHAVHC